MPLYTELGVSYIPEPGFHADGQISPPLDKHPPVPFIAVTLAHESFREVDPGKSTNPSESLVSRFSSLLGSVCQALVSLFFQATQFFVQCLEPRCVLRKREPSITRIMKRSRKKECTSGPSHLSLGSQISPQIWATYLDCLLGGQ
jgi:hypothetical protein